MLSDLSFKALTLPIVLRLVKWNNREISYKKAIIQAKKNDGGLEQGSS